MKIDLLGICLPSFCICTNSTKYCKHGIDLLLLCNIGVLQLIYFQVEGFHEVKICSFQAFSGHLLLVVGRFRSFFAHDRSFQIIYCLFQVISGCFRSFLARYRLLQVVSDRFRLFLVSENTEKKHILREQSLWGKN